MSRILADKVTNYNNDGPFMAEQGVEFPIGKPLVVAGSAGASGNYLASTGAGLVWQIFPELFSGDYNDLENRPILFSGDYDDLNNKPSLLPFEVLIPVSNQILLYNDTTQRWENGDLPAIYTYTLFEEAGSNSETAYIKLQDNFGLETYIRLVGGNGITFDAADGDISIISPTVVEYDANTAKDDVSYMFRDGSHSGITFTWDEVNKTFDASVALAEQLVYTFEAEDVDDGSGGIEPDQVNLKLTTDTTTNGNVKLIGSNGINLDWNIGLSELTISKTDPPEYVLPIATDAVLGGVRVDNTSIVADASGVLSANIDISNKIEFSSLSVVNQAASGVGDLSYDDTTGRFDFTPPAPSLNSLTDVNLSETIQNSEIIQWNGNNWTNVSVSNVYPDLDGLTDVDVSTATSGQYLYFDGTSWRGEGIDLNSASIHTLNDVSGLAADNVDGMFLKWDSATSNWAPTNVIIQDFDVVGAPADGDTLLWDELNNYWTVGSPGGGGSSVTQLNDLSDVDAPAVNNGDILVFNGSVFAPASPGAASLPSRSTRSASNNGIMGTGDSEDLTISGFPGYNLYKINVNQAAWVTVYCDETSRTADASRPESQDPTPGSGVIAEAVTTGSGDVLFTPAVVGFNNQDPAVGNIYIKVVNKGGSINAGDLTVTLTLLPTEV